MRVIVAALVILATRASAETKPETPTIAVLDFEAIPAGDKDQLSVAATLTETMATELLATKAFRIIERRHIAKVMKELALGQTGAVDEQNAAKVGQLLGAKFLLVGSVSRVAGKQLVQARQIRVETAAAESAQSVSFSDIDDLPEACRDLARRFAGGAAAGSVSTFGDFDAKILRETARSLARQIAGHFPVVKGRLVSVLPNGKAGCDVGPGAFRGELFEVVAFDQISESKKSMGQARIDQLGTHSCQASYKRTSGPIEDGAEITSQPVALRIDVSAEPAALAPVAAAFKTALADELLGAGSFRATSGDNVSLVAKGHLTGKRGARKIEVQIFDRDNGVLTTAATGASF